MSIEKLRDYDFYARNYLKINTKAGGMISFTRRLYQKRFTNFLQSIDGPKRVIVVKPRQAGFSTDVAGYFTNRMTLYRNYKGILLADKSARTDEVMGIYHTYINNLPKKLLPMIDKLNTEEILFDNPNKSLRLKHPGLNSGLKAETANDPNAGRAGTRKFAHMTEAAFYRYALEIDEGIQNSIPLTADSCIIKESTANGRVGHGKAFYDLYQAAKQGESIYKPFFVAWYEVDDYQIKPQPDFKLTKYEADLIKLIPTITEHHLAWRRLKVSEYMQDNDESFLSPEERFKQDFPVTDDEAFLSTGQPVFPPEAVNAIINKLNKSRPPDIQDRLKLPIILQQFKKGLRLFSPPRQGVHYYIGADVAEGLAHGDSSSCYIMNHEYKQVGRWHGKIDPDLFGHLLIALGDLYNTAWICPENNNMGHTTVTTIRQAGYPKLYKTVKEDNKTRVKSTTYGYRTTGPSRDDMLNEGIARLRDGDAKILDVKLPIQMSEVARGDNGKCDLGGKDRVVAYCLTVICRRQHRPPRHMETASRGVRARVV